MVDFGPVPEGFRGHERTGRCDPIMIRHRSIAHPFARNRSDSTRVGKSDSCQPEWLGRAVGGGLSTSARAAVYSSYCAMKGNMIDSGRLLEARSPASIIGVRPRALAIATETRASFCGLACLRCRQIGDRVMTADRVAIRRLAPGRRFAVTDRAYLARAAALERAALRRG